MNDDLISRKAVLDVLNDVDQDGLLKISQIIDFIKDQPTAFDEEKVIEELQNVSLKLRISGNFNGSAVADRSIEIVEKGGIE